MLNLDHPLTQHIFRASSLIDGVMVRGQQMSVAPSAVRAELLAECLPLFAELRDLAQTQFSNRVQYLIQAIEEYEAGVRQLAALGDGQITEDRRDGEGNCPYCRTPIMKFDAFVGCHGLEPHYVILCNKCDKLYAAARDKLTGWDGFGTDAI